MQDVENAESGKMIGARELRSGGEAEVVSQTEAFLTVNRSRKTSADNGGGDGDWRVNERRTMRPMKVVQSFIGSAD